MVNQIIEIVKEASVFMQREAMEVHKKGNESNYVTSADIQVQNFLEERLIELLPGSHLIGEENDSNPSDGDFIWVIDPIDGTSNFIRDIGLSVISVALLKRGEPYLGVVYHPYRNEMYWAESGKGAFLNGKQIHVSERDFRHSHLCSAMSLYEKAYAKPCFNVIEKVYEKADDLRRLGSAALETAMLAAGRVELYFEIRVYAWDVAATAVIIKEAGGHMEFMFHESLPLNKPFGVIAANTKENFEQLKTIVYGEIPQAMY